MQCCTNPSHSRVTILGQDNKNITILWQKLTKTTNHPKQNRHLEKTIKLHDSRISLCSVESTENSLWELNMRHSEGVILVIDEKELVSDQVSKFINETDKFYLLILCNTKNIGDFKTNKPKNDLVKIHPCSIDEWKGVDEGLKWLTNCLRNK